MAVQLVTIAPAQLTSTSITTIYTNVGGKTVIDSLVVCNTSASPVTLDAYLAATGSAGAANQLLKSKTLAAGEAYAVRELIGQILDTSGAFSLKAGTANALTYAFAGRQVT